MKSAFIRTMAVAMLATSISAFAMSDKTKACKDTNSNSTNSATAPGSVNEPNSNQDQAQSDPEKDKSTTQQKIQEQDREWLHNLQGIYGG